MSYQLPKIWQHPNNTTNPFFNAERMIAGAQAIIV
jgi:hypothetical protein